MVSEKAIYWISVGLLAFVVTNNFNFNAKQEVASRVTEATTIFAQRILDRGMGYVAAAEVALNSKRECPRAQLAMVQAQTRMVRVQTDMDCDRAALARLQGENARFIQLRELKRATVRLNSQNFKIDVNDIPNVSVNTSF